jgi:hypothetical protein
MFFLAGDPNLSAQMISQLKAITDAGYQEETTVLVHFDPNSNGTSAQVFNVNHLRKLNHDQEKLGPRRTVIGDGRNSFVRNIKEDCYGQQMLTGASADETLRSFLRYARVNYRAQNYMLFFIGHGMIVANDAFLPDTEPETTSAITLKQLGGVLKEFSDEAKTESGEFQLIGFHSCSMSAVEVAYELKNTARYMMGAQGLAFVGSWPHRQLLKRIFKFIEDSKTGSNDAPTDTRTLAQEMLESIQGLSFYNAEDFGLAGYSADVSLCSLDEAKVDSLTEPLKELSLALRSGLKYQRTTERILLAHWKAQSFWQENYTDLFDFCDCLAEQCQEESEPQIALRNACAQVLQVLKTDSEGPFDRLVAYSDYFGPEYQYAHGLSIYFPWASPAESVLKKYRHYAFTRPIVPENSDEPEAPDTWLSFLKDYFNLTQRDVRGGTRDVVSLPGAGVPDRALSAVAGRPNTTLGSVEGKPNPALGNVEGKPNPALGNVEGKPNPALGNVEGKPNPALGNVEGKPNPALGNVEGKPNPALGNVEGKPNPALGNVEGKPNPALGNVEGKPNPALGNVEGKPNPALGNVEGKPNPALGVSGFGFTVTKNYPAPTDMILTSRPKPPYEEDRGGHLKNDKTTEAT